MWPRHWIALLLCVAVVVCCTLPLTVAAAETVTVMSTAINRVGETVDGLTFTMGSPTTSVTTPVSVQGCSITGSGLTFQMSNTTLVLNATVADATVTDATIVLTGNPTSYSSIVIRGVTATITGTTPLVNMQSYEPNAYTTLSIMDIAAAWTDGSAGGAVVYTGGLAQQFTNSALIVHHVHAKNAAHLFIYDAPMCSGTLFCLDSTTGLISFAFNYCEDCTGPMISVAVATPFSCGNSGLVRFANNTITGGQPFFNSIFDYGLYAGTLNGHIIVSGIYSDGNLFSVPTLPVVMYGDSSITMRHINVRALGIPNNGLRFPYVDGDPTGTSQRVFLGNITENGVRFDETTRQGYSNLNIAYSVTVLVNDMGFIAYNPNQLTGMGGSGTPSPSWAYCQRSYTASVSTEVLYSDSAMPVLRPMCVCTDSTVYMPYCTRRQDPYAWYDGFNALDTLKVFLVESRAGVASPQTYAGSLQNLCPTYNATLYEPTTVTQQGALGLMMSARSVSSNANVYVGAQYAGQTTQDGSWTWTTTDDAFTSKYGLDSDDPSLSAVPSTTAYTNWATANPAMTVAADGTPSARYMAMNSASGGWVNPAAETRTFYAACVAAPAPKAYDITIAARSGTSLSSEALCGENRAPLVVLDADVQAALERKLIETNADATATVLLGGLYNTDTSAWTWVRDVRDVSTAVSAFGSTNTSAYTDWALNFPSASVDTERYIGFSASTGGWVNVASVADVSYVACEPMSYTPDTTGLYTVTLPAGWKSTTENMALMCYSDGVQGRLMQPTTEAKEAALEYIVTTASNANTNTVGIFGLFYSAGTWSWVSAPQYYPDGATPLNAGSDFTNWASGYPQSSVASGAVAGFSAAAGGWVDVDPSTVTNWVVVCEPLPADEPADDAMNKIYTVAVTSVPLAGANAMMQACAATNLNPVLTLTSAAAERALKRRLLLDGVDTTSTTVVVGGYFTDTSLQSGDWVWINSWDDSQPTAFTNHYALTSQPAATAVVGAYTNWAASYPTSSSSSSAGRFVAFDAQQDGWINTAAATSPLYVACETYDMTAAEAADMLFIAKAQVTTSHSFQFPSIYRGNLDNLCPAFNGTLFEPNSVLKQRALTLVRSAQGVSSTTAVFVGGEYSGKTQTDGTWNWASSGAFMQNYAVTGSTGTAAALVDRYNNWVSSYPSGTLPTNNLPGSRFAAVYQNGWSNPTSTSDTSVVAACAPGPTLYNYGIKSVSNPKNTFSPTLMCGRGYSVAIVPNASVQAAIERVIFSSGQNPALGRMLSLRYNVTTGRYVWLRDLRDPATAVSSFVPGDTSDGSYQNWAPLLGPPTDPSTWIYAATKSQNGGWTSYDTYLDPTYLACQPYAHSTDEQTDTLFIVKAPTGMAAPQTYAGGLENLCRAYNATLYEPSTAYRQDALEMEMNTLIAAGMANTADVYIGARYYGDTETGGVWAYESSNGTSTGVFTDNFATGRAVVLTNRFTSWATGYPAGSLTTDGTPGPRFVASRRDLNGWVNPTTETTDFYAACFTSTPPEEFDITLMPRSGLTMDSYSLCGETHAPLLVLNASVQAALERKLIRDGVATSSTVLLGGLYNTGTSAWTWVRDLRDSSTTVSLFGSASSSAYTDWALNYPVSPPASQQLLGFSAAAGGWVNVAVLSDTAYVACEPYTKPVVNTSKEPCTTVSTCPRGLSNDPTNPGTCIKARCFVRHCEMCLSNYQTRCDICDNGYELDKYTGTCMKPRCQVIGCKSCELGNTFRCEECAPGYLLDATTARCGPQQCQVDQCRTCAAGRTDFCKTCSDGYVVNATTGQCVEPPCEVKNCATCILGDVSRCYKCSTGYALDSHQTCDACPSGYKMNAARECVSSKLPTGTLVGIIVGVMGGVVIIGVTLFFIWLLLWRSGEPVTYVMTVTPEPSLVDGPTVFSLSTSASTTPALILVDEVSGAASVTTKRRSSAHKLTKAQPSASVDPTEAAAFPPLNLDLNTLIALQAHLSGTSDAADAPNAAQHPVAKRRASRNTSTTRMAREGDSPVRLDPALSTAEPSTPLLPSTSGSDSPSTVPTVSPQRRAQQQPPNVFMLDNETEPSNEPATVVKVVKRRRNRKDS